MPKKRPLFFRHRAPANFFLAHRILSLGQALAVWKWHNFLDSRAPPGRTTVRINMDESPLKFDQVRRTKGLIAIPKAELKRKRETLVRPASLSLRRSVITLIAFVCDDAATQKLLPQVVVGNRRLLPRKVADLYRLRSDSVYVLSRTSGWNNAKLQCEILKMLGKLLAPLQKTHWFILVLDAHASHIAPRVFRRAHRAGLSMLVVPAAMTHLLQPLDTHVFSVLKYELWKACQTLMFDSDTGEFDLEKFLTAVCCVVSRILGASNRHAFESCGFSRAQHGLGDRVLHALEWTTAPVVSSDLPTLHDLQQCWPAGRHIPIETLFLNALMKAPQEQDNEVEPFADSAAPAPPTPPLRLRLRSASRVKLPEPAADAPAALPAPTPSSEPPPPVFAAWPAATTSAASTPVLRRLPVGRPLLPPQRRPSSRQLDTSHPPL